jgi:hypothetical protein
LKFDLPLQSSLCELCPDKSIETQRTPRENILP